MKPGERIRQLRKAKKMTLNELAVRIGSDVGNLSRLERGRQGYSDGLLQKIADALAVPVSALFSPVEATRAEPHYHAPSLAGVDREDIYRVEMLDLHARTTEGSAARDVAQVIRSIEYVHKEASAIFGNKPDTLVRLINVRGDSMEGTIEPGDLIFVDVSVPYFDGDGIYVFDFNGDTFVKRLQKVKSELYVISDNPRYREWTISAEEMPMLHVSGRVMLSQSQQLRRHG